MKWVSRNGYEKLEREKVVGWTRWFGPLQKSMNMGVKKSYVSVRDGKEVSLMGMAVLDSIH